MRQFSNTAVEAELTSSAAGVDTTIVVDSTTGFPVTFPYTLSIDAETASKELVEVTDASGTTLTVTRGIDGTTAQAHSIGAAVRHDHSARDFREAQEHIAAESDVHGVTGDLVGSTMTQPLTNKDLTDPSNTFPPSLATDAELTTHAALTTGVHGAGAGAVVGTTLAQILTNKTFDLALNTLTGTKAQFNTALSDGDFASQAGAETLTNKTFDLASNSLTGTRAQFNTALSDGDFATLAGAETLTNKRTTKRVTSAASASSLTPDISTTDEYVYTDLAENLTIDNPTGTPVQGDELLFRIMDDGTSRTLTYDTEYRGVDGALPPSTDAGKVMYLLFVYNADDTKWDMVSKSFEGREGGTWTPVINNVADTSAGHYTRVGDWVFADFLINVTGTSTASITLNISSLPVPPATVTGGVAFGTAICQNASTSYFLFCYNAGTVIHFAREFDGAWLGDPAGGATTTLVNGEKVHGTLHYRVA